LMSSPKLQKRPSTHRINHRREKYLEKIVARLRAHNRLIREKQQKKKAEDNFFKMLIEYSEQKNGR
jgi:uncharacterized membrane protein